MKQQARRAIEKKFSSEHLFDYQNRAIIPPLRNLQRRGQRMEHLLAGLNRAQHEAVTATEGMSVSSRARAQARRVRCRTALRILSTSSASCREHPVRDVYEQVSQRDAPAYPRLDRRQRHGLYQHVPRLLCLRFAGGQPRRAVPEELSGAG